MVTLLPEDLPVAGEPYPADMPVECYVCGADAPELFSMPPKETSYYCDECSVVFDVPVGNVPSGS